MKGEYLAQATVLDCFCGRVKANSWDEGLEEAKRLLARKCRYEFIVHYEFERAYGEGAGPDEYDFTIHFETSVLASGPDRESAAAALQDAVSSNHFVCPVIPVIGIHFQRNE